MRERFRPRSTGRRVWFGTKVSAVVLAAGAITGAGIHGEVKYGDPFAHAVKVTDEVLGSLTECDPISQLRITEAEAALKTGYANSPAVPATPPTPREMLTDATLPALAKKHGVHLADNALGTHDELRSMDSARLAGGRVSAYFRKQYGIAVTVEDPSQYAVQDTAELTAAFYPWPKELVQRVAATDLDEIVLGANDKRFSDPDAVSAYDSATDTIYIRSGAVDAPTVASEFFAPANAAANAFTCYSPDSSRQPNFTDANPLGFTYGSPGADWKGVTFTREAAINGGRNTPSEDISITGAQILLGGTEGAIACPYDQSPVLSHKLNIALATIAKLSEGSQSYLAERFTSGTDPDCL